MYVLAKVVLEIIFLYIGIILLPDYFNEEIPVFLQIHYVNISGVNSI